MKDQRSTGPGLFLAVPVAQAVLALPRATKRLIIALPDALAVLAALWGALALKFDVLLPLDARTLPYYTVAVLSALFFFSLLGLYRAVIRFVGPKAMLTVLAGVGLPA